MSHLNNKKTQQPVTQQLDCEKLFTVTAAALKKWVVAMGYVSDNPLLARPLFQSSNCKSVACTAIHHEGAKPFGYEKRVITNHSEF